MRGFWIAGIVSTFMLGACTTGPMPDGESVSTSVPISEESAFAADFGMLADLVGTRWYGEPSQADAERGQPADYSEWNWDLGGSVLVNRHVLADGSYGGLTYVQKNQKSEKLDYVYITSAGFRTSGSFTLNEDNSWTAYEEVTGLSDIIGVRSTGRMTEDGALVSESEFETRDGWVPGHTFRYEPTSDTMPNLVPNLEIE
ncbi:hypothetical protein [uncultured Hyphomonas sp.]|uniref:hypothetical protein n=1 Tax=uncultured Hyphomonas sp. TaxID=225298 RepID=UPI0030DC7F34